jgi:hypothetical protein
MEEILREKFLAHYYQIALVDYEGPESYPEWDNGEETAILGPKGVVVSTPTDGFVETLVLTGENSLELPEIISGVIDIGNSGIFVGNETSSSYKIIPWLDGKTSIKVFLDRIDSNNVRVIFVINK